MRLDVSAYLFEFNGVKKLIGIPCLDLGQTSISGLGESKHCHPLAAYIGFEDEVVWRCSSADAEAIPAARKKGYDMTPIAVLTKVM